MIGRSQKTPMSGGMWRFLVWLSFCSVAGTTWAGELSDGGSRIAVFPLVSQNVDREIVRAIEIALGETSVHFLGAHVFAGSRLRKVARTTPRAVVARCERSRDFGECIARWAVKNQMGEVLLARAKSSGSNVELLILAVKSNGSVESRAKLHVGSPAEVRQKLNNAELRRVFGADVAATGPEISAADSQGDHKRSAQINREIPPNWRKMRQDTTHPATAETPSTIHASQPEHLPRPQAAEPPLLTPKYNREPQPQTRALSMPVDTEKPAEPRSWLTWGGIGGLVAGVIACSAGAYYASQARAKRAAIRRDGSVVQREAVARNLKAERTLDRANLLLVLGAASTAAGSTLFGIDIALAR